MEPTSYRQHVPPADIRQSFSSAMSAMYSKEVPLYGELLDLVGHSNRSILERDTDLREKLEATDNLDRIHVERHGAIRVGLPEELAQVAQVLKVMDMVPTGYYDLASANIPVHATCFRPHKSSELTKNPFRLFVSLLRPELISSDVLRDKALDILSHRQIFSKRMFELLNVFNANQGLVESEAREFVSEATKSFQWHTSAAVTQDVYQDLASDSAILADIVAFRSPHINHLTPRALDIDAVQALMNEWNIPAKDCIEGPPKRNCPILLRQTSFKAIEEPIDFLAGVSELSHESTGYVPGHHKARFGEIEQRGAALTVAGRSLYDSLLGSARAKGINASNEKAFAEQFASFPDSWKEMRDQGLAWFWYYVNPSKRELVPPTLASFDLESLIEQDWIRYEPIVYEDFLPISAAGIFQSNLSKDRDEAESVSLQPATEASKMLFEKALGIKVKDEMVLYRQLQDESIEQCRKWMERK